VSKISSEYGVHANQLYQWKAQALKNLPRLFDEEQAKAKTNQVNQKLDELNAEIGRLTTQVNRLKKKSGLESLSLCDRDFFPPGHHSWRRAD
jgi:transposase